MGRGQSERLQKLHNRCARIIVNFKDEPGNLNLLLNNYRVKNVGRKKS